MFLRWERRASGSPCGNAEHFFTRLMRYGEHRGTDLPKQHRVPTTAKMSVTSLRRRPRRSGRRSVLRALRKPRLATKKEVAGGRTGDVMGRGPHFPFCGHMGRDPDISDPLPPCPTVMVSQQVSWDGVTRFEMGTLFPSISHAFFH